MKKLLSSFVVILALMFLVACVPSDDTTPDTVKPILSGVANKEIQFGEVFNPLDGVTAIDDVDGDLKANIIVTGTVNNQVPGPYTLKYEVSDKSNNKAEATRIITVLEKASEANFIKNGDFSQPLDADWTHWAGEGGASTISLVDGEAVLNITANGSQWYSTQFSHPNLTITQGLMYRLEFEARSDLPRGIVVKLEDASYDGYIDELVELDNTMTKYSFDFFVLKPTITNGKLIFGGGTMTSRGVDAGALTTVYFDNVSLTIVEAGEDDVAPVIRGANDKNIAVNEAFDPLDGVSVTDNRDLDLTVDDIKITGNLDITTPGVYVLTYEVTDAAGNKATLERTITVLEGLLPSTWEVVNGDFSEDQLSALPQPATTGWGWHGNASFSAQITNGVAKIEINNLANVVHGVQFYQQGRVITQGQIYKITFDAKADIPRPIMVALEEGTTRRFDEIVFLDTDWQSYEIYIEYVLTSIENGKFAFFMGDIGDDSVPTTVYLDNIEVETVSELVDNIAPQLFGVLDYVVAKDATFNPLQGITLREYVDKTLTIEDVVITGTVDTATIGEYELTYEITDAAGNKSTYTRMVYVIAAEEMSSNTFNVVNGDMEVDQLTPTAQPAMTGWGWHGTGTFTIQIEDGIATIDVTNPGTVPHGVQFYQQNRVVETGATYLLTFKAKVDIARSFRLSLESGVDVRFFNIIDVTTEWETYNVYITASGGGFTNGKLGFFMGYIDETSVATTFYLDDINLELVGYRKDVEKPLITNVKDVVVEKGSEFDPLAGVHVFDVIDKGLTKEDIVVTGTVDTQTTGTYELTYVLTDKSGNSTTVTRNVTVVEVETE